jgi:hypothetical protein
MDAVKTTDFGELYNSTLEAGIRAVIVLEQLRPETVDLAEMVLLDHVVVHTADVGGPASLHAAVPARKGELLVRRRLVEQSLELMRRCHLVEQQAREDGLVWCASDEAASYVELLQTSYSIQLKSCASWLSTEIRRRGKNGFKAFVRGRIGEWTEAFGPSGEAR